MPMPQRGKNLLVMDRKHSLQIRPGEFGRVPRNARHELPPSEISAGRTRQELPRQKRKTARNLNSAPSKTDFEA